MQTDNLPAYEDLEPASVWSFFAEISAVPRPSKQEERVRNRVRELAEARGFATRTDDAGNLLIEVPATPGREQAPPVVLQGHLDMVCEKNSGTAHDFERDGIRLAVDRDRETGRVIVRAKETTLGADNGIGLSLAWAAATSPEVVHGPLELLCTTDEEMGMGGAAALAADFVKGRTLLNHDSEDDALYVGCAGGCDLTFSWEFGLSPVAPAHEFVAVAVGGLRGGHSGGDIHENRGNAVRLLTRVLAGEGVPALRLIEMNGGGRRNALAREASALVAGPSGCAAALAAAAARVQAEWRASTEPDCAVTAELRSSVRAAALSPEDTARLLRGVQALPHGVLAVVPEIAGLVQSSNNVATVQSETTAEGRLRVTVACMARSSYMPGLYEVTRQARAAGELAGAAVEIGKAYPGWQPRLESPVLGVCQRVYKSLYGEEPQVKAIHAGLECGIIGDRIPGMDMVSFGPDIKGAHSPDERVFPDSVLRTWGFLKALLEELARPAK